MARSTAVEAWLWLGDDEFAAMISCITTQDVAAIACTSKLHHHKVCRCLSMFWTCPSAEDLAMALISVATKRKWISKTEQLEYIGNTLDRDDALLANAS